MDKILFYNYIRHIKDSQEPIYREVLSFPKVAQILLALTGVSIVSGMACILIEKLRPGFIYSLAGEMLICFVTFLYTENYIIVYSKSKFSERLKYCSDLFCWLKEY